MAGGRSDCVIIRAWTAAIRFDPISPLPSARAAFSSAMAASASGAGVRSSRAIPTCRSSTWCRASRAGRPGRRTRSARVRPVTAGGATPRHWTGSKTASGGGSARTTRRSGPASSASTGRSPSAGASGGRGPTSPVSCGGSRERSRRAAACLASGAPAVAGMPPARRLGSAPSDTRPGRPQLGESGSSRRPNGRRSSGRPEAPRPPVAGQRRRHG